MSQSVKKKIKTKVVELGITQSSYTLRKKLIQQYKRLFTLKERNEFLKKSVKEIEKIIDERIKESIVIKVRKLPKII